MLEIPNQDPKHRALCSDIVATIRQAFPSRDLLILLYGSGASGCVTSDLDICTFAHHITSHDRAKMGKLLAEFHKQKGLRIDHDVPYENKSLFAYSEIIEAIQCPPFQVTHRGFLLRDIRMTRDYLNSEEVRRRLLLNILTTKTLVLEGCKTVLENYSVMAWRTLVRLLFSFLGNRPLSQDDFVQTLCTNPYSRKSGEDFLGYKPHKQDALNYLKLRVGTLFPLFVEEGFLQHDGHTYCCAPAWLFELERMAWRGESQRACDYKQPEYLKMRLHDFAENANPLGPPRRLLELLSESPRYANVYPDYTNKEIETALARFFRTAPECVAATNGSLEPIFAIPRILDSDHPALAVPTYWGFEACLKLMGKEPRKIPFLADLRFDQYALIEAAKTATIMYLCNPNNPTSSLMSRDAMESLVAEHPNCHFIVDESHLLLSPSFFQRTLSNAVSQYSNLSLVYSLSKFFNVAGLRIGALIADQDLIQTYKEWQIPYSLNTIAQAYFPSCLEDEEFITTTRQEIPRLREILVSGLQGIEWIQVMPSSTNFVLCKLLDGVTAVRLAKRCESDGFLIRELTSHYGGLKGEWVRISVQLEEITIRLLACLRNYTCCLNELKEQPA